MFGSAFALHAEMHVCRQATMRSLDNVNEDEMIWELYTIVTEEENYGKFLTPTSIVLDIII